MYKPHLPIEPTKPIPNKEKGTIAYEIGNTTVRVNHWGGWGEGRGSDPDADENYHKVIDKVGMQNRGQVIRLSEVVKHLPKHIKIEDLYFTASFSDDRLQLHVRYDEETELYQEQMKKYQEDMEEWKYAKANYNKQMTSYEAELKKELALIKKP